MHDVLSSRDPVAAARMEPRNGRRIVRALEVIEITGEPYNAGLGVPKAFIPTVRIGLRRPRAELDELIANRVDRMWQQGWVDEVRDLLERGLAQAPTASRALGYAQIAAYLAGECDEETAREVTTTATRRFLSGANILGSIVMNASTGSRLSGRSTAHERAERRTFAYFVTAAVASCVR